MKKKEIEKLKLRLRAEKAPASGVASKQPSVVPRKGLMQQPQPKRRGQI
jgi:hypothetical protein